MLPLMFIIYHALGEVSGRSGYLKDCTINEANEVVHCRTFRMNSICVHFCSLRYKMTID